MFRSFKQSACAISVALAFLSSATPVIADTPVLKAYVLKFGTVNWELDVIRHHALDTKNGFTLQVHGVAGGFAAKVAFQGGEADVIVSD